MEKKKNKGVIVLIVLLILCIIGLVFYILADKDIIKLNNTTVENAQVEDFNFFQIIGVLTLLLVLIAIIFFNKKYRNGKK